MSEQLAILNQPHGVSVFGSMDLFEQAQRMVKPLVESTMVPEAYRGNTANCLVAMEMSHRIGKSVLEVMQNMQPVKGNVGWKSEYVISEINRSGLFKKNLRFIFSEDRQSCYATATTKDGEVLRGTAVTMAMAKAEGWIDKNGSKWKTMPEQMLMYRAATFFCRVHCPEVLAGVQTADEIIDIGVSDPTKDTDGPISDINSKVSPEAESHYTAFEEISETEAPAEPGSDSAPAQEDADF